MSILHLFLENEYLGQKTEQKFTFFKLYVLNKRVLGRQGYEQEAAVGLHLGNHSQRIPSPRLDLLSWPQFCRKDLHWTLKTWLPLPLSDSTPCHSGQSLGQNNMIQCCISIQGTTAPLAQTLLSNSWYKTHWNVQRRGAEEVGGWRWDLKGGN